MDHTCTASGTNLRLGAAQPHPSTPEPEDCFSLVGTVVEGRYLVERLVGSGGYGVVYRARHLRLDSPVALKVLRIGNSVEPGRRAAIIERFAIEGRLAFELGGQHRSIARVLECGLVCVASERAGPLPYLALEWLDGISLSEQLRSWRREGRGPLSLAATISLMTPIAEALAAAHAQGVAHRDVKPANIMLARRGAEHSAVLLDFGLAKAGVLGESTTERFDSSDGATPAFTPSYAAPEQWLRRLGATGPWTDVHALALVCVELLTGRKPFEAEDTQQLMAACVDLAARPLPRRVGVACAPEVEAVLERALCVSPRERFRDARSFWSELCRAHEAPTRSANAGRARNWRRRSAWLALAATLALAGQVRGDRAPEHAAATAAPLRKPPALERLHAATMPGASQTPASIPPLSASASSAVRMASAPLSASAGSAVRMPSAPPRGRPPAASNAKAAAQLEPEPERELARESSPQRETQPTPPDQPARPANLLESNAFSLRH